MVCGVTFSTPPGITNWDSLTLTNIVKATLASHYRLAKVSQYEPESPSSIHSTHPTTALQISPSISIINSQKEPLVDYLFHLNNPLSSPAIHTNIILHDEPATWTNESTRKISVIWSVHHALGDGMSSWALARSFLNLCTLDNFNTAINLQQFNVQQDPPFILDKLWNPWFFEIIPALFQMLSSLIKRNVFGMLHGRDHRTFI